MAECGFLKRHGFRCVSTGSTPAVSVSAGRHVSFPPATSPPVQSPAPAALQPAPASVPAPPPAIGRATYASVLSSFPPAPSDDDDISVGYDFIGSDGSHNTTSEATTSYYAPCFVDEEQCPAPFIVPPPTPPSRGLLPSWLLRPLLFLICVYSTCHQSLNSNTSLLPNCRTVRQAVQSYVFPAPSVCVGTASMTQPQQGNSSLGRILVCALHTCVSTAGLPVTCARLRIFPRITFPTQITTTSLWPTAAASTSRAAVRSVSSSAATPYVFAIVSTCPTSTCSFYQPASIDVAVKAAPSSHTLATGCFLTFPSFIIPIDDTLECLVPCSTAPPTSTFDYNETNTLTYPKHPLSTGDQPNEHSTVEPGTTMVVLASSRDHSTMAPSSQNYSLTQFKKSFPSHSFRLPLIQPISH
jgi:hypothetical protein